MWLRGWFIFDTTTRFPAKCNRVNLGPRNICTIIRGGRKSSAKRRTVYRLQIVAIQVQLLNILEYSILFSPVHTEQMGPKINTRARISLSLSLSLCSLCFCVFPPPDTPQTFKESKNRKTSKEKCIRIKKWEKNQRKSYQVKSNKRLQIRKSNSRSKKKKLCVGIKKRNSVNVAKQETPKPTN